jgi:AraC-like DNA-binding protein
MRFQFVSPSGLLKNYISHYSLMETDSSESCIKERVIPVESLQLMFHYRLPFAVFQPDGSLRRQPRSVLSGLSSTYSDVTTLGESGVIFVAFKPSGACHFFRFPLLEMKDKSIDLADIDNRGFRQTEEQIYGAKTTEERISVVEKFLLDRYSPISVYDEALINNGIRLIQESSGHISAAGLAQRLSVTSKTMERKFAAYIGKTPGQYAKLIRFRRILAGFDGKQKLSLTEHAFMNGYFDQAHFIHDFKKYSGYTPREFLTAYPNFDVNEYSCG